MSVYIWTQLTSRALLYGCIHLDPAHALQFKPSFQALLCPNSQQKKHKQGLVSVYIWTQLTGRVCSLKVFTFWPSLIIAYSINPQVLVWQDDLWMAGQYLDYLVSTRQENESKRMKVKVWVWTLSLVNCSISSNLMLLWNGCEQECKNSKDLNQPNKDTE